MYVRRRRQEGTSLRAGGTCRSKRRFTPEAAYSAIGRFRIRVGACEAPATSLARVAGLRRAKLRPAALSRDSRSVPQPSGEACEQREQPSAPERLRAADVCDVVSRHNIEKHATAWRDFADRNPIAKQSAGRSLRARRPASYRHGRSAGFVPNASDTSCSSTPRN